MRNAIISFFIQKKEIPSNFIVNNYIGAIWKLLINVCTPKLT